MNQLEAEQAIDELQMDTFANTVVARLQMHDPKTIPTCLLCKDVAHSFDDCPLLNDGNFKTSFIIKMLSLVSLANFTMVTRNNKTSPPANTCIDHIFDYGDTFNDGYGINIICSEHSALLSLADILHDNKEDDDDLDSDDMTHQHSSQSTTPINDFLAQLTAGNVPTPDVKFLHQILSDTSSSTKSPVLFDGPHAHFDDGSQVSTTHEASHLHSYQCFTTQNPCRTRLIPADG
jgi:hypothetical protein